jgi:F-type H+-transporting ATPase subunit b
MDAILSNFLAQFLWGLAAFVVFVLIVFKLGVKHILAAVDAREAKIKADLQSATDAAGHAAKVIAENEAKLKEAEHDIAERMAEARRDAEANKAKLIDQGRVEIDAMRHRALREIEAARHTAVVSLRREIAEISVAVAEKAARVQLDPAKQEELVLTAIEAYETQHKDGN